VRNENVAVDRQICTVVLTDLVGYGHMMAFDPHNTQVLLQQRHDALMDRVRQADGRLVSERGDGYLLEFMDPVKAATCVLDFLEDVIVKNATLPSEKRLNFRIGMHYGEVFVTPPFIYGDTVTIAARLEQMAEPGAVFVSDQLRVEIQSRSALGFEDLGFRDVKSARTAVHVWRMTSAATLQAVERARHDAGGAMPQERVAEGKIIANRAVAVLPFTNLSHDEDQAYLAEGLAEDIIGSIAKSSWLMVVDRNSSFNVKSEGQGSAQICEALGVRYLVLGSVRRMGAMLRITAELVDGVTLETLWTGRFDRPYEDIFAVQDEICEAIVGTIEPLYLRQEERRALNGGPRDLKHWDLLMRARWKFWRSSRQLNLDSQALLEQALMLKPNDSATLSLLAFSYLTEVWSGWTKEPHKFIAEANRLALKAVRADDLDSFAHFTLGSALSCTGNITGAVSAMRRALVLHPHFAAASGELGRLLAFMGETEEALTHIARALRSSPTDPHLSLWVRSSAIAHFLAGRFDAAIQSAQEAIAKRNDWFFNHYLLAACQAANGELDSAYATMAVAKSMKAEYTLSTVLFGHPFHKPEDRDSFLAALRLAGWSG